MDPRSDFGQERTNKMARWLFLYGPSGSGKSTLGRIMAENLSLNFFDLDHEIERTEGMNIQKVFEAKGEGGFRNQEKSLLAELLVNDSGILALGGGTLLDSENRDLVCDAGSVLCLHASIETLLKRIRVDGHNRPLLEGNREERLHTLLEERSEHYGSFSLHLNTDLLSSAKAAREAQTIMGAFRVEGMDRSYEVRVQDGHLKELSLLLSGTQSPLGLITDENVGKLYSAGVTEAFQDFGLRVYEFRIPAGENHKSLETASKIWEFFARSRLERGSVIIAMGGGVVGDLAGFAAANFLRGVPWVILPTSLLAMVDASIGGKTGVNLPEGKNLVGAFHSPQAVYADLSTLSTLPEIEMKSGLAEVIKHGVIADPGLFEICKQGFITGNIRAVVSRAMAVKIKIVQEDPYETGLREVLNLGHTVGHAIEKLSNYSIRHGEAIAMGMVAEARMSEALGIADPGLGECLSATLSGVELPGEIPGALDRSELVEAMQVDKKRKGGVLRFSLPVSIGEVRTGVEIEPEDVLKMIS